MFNKGFLMKKILLGTKLWWRTPQVPNKICCSITKIDVYFVVDEPLAKTVSSLQDTLYNVIRVIFNIYMQIYVNRCFSLSDAIRWNQIKLSKFILKRAIYFGTQFWRKRRFSFYLKIKYCRHLNSHL